MAPIDPYRLLQVHPEADVEIIQAAYRKLAQRYHPDVAAGPDAERRMAELNSARDLLLDPERRAAYDRERAIEQAAATRAAAARSASRSAAGPRAASAAGDRAETGAGRAAPVSTVAREPPGDPSGSVLLFGRYAGWSLGEIARENIDYIEWLDRMPIGRLYRDELDAILRLAGRRGVKAPPERPHGLFRRR